MKDYLGRVTLSAQLALRGLTIATGWVMAILPVYGGHGAGDTTAARNNTRCTQWTSIGTGVAFGGTLLVLDQAWYADYPRSPLHSFNDGREWLQLDKAGHLFSAYTLGAWGHRAFQRCAPEERWPVWVGGSMGLLFLSGVELLDGTSAQWGFSWWDMAANVAGTGLYIGQEQAWKEQRLRVKLSAVPTDFAALRPALLGETLPERILKDYNGQTLWLSGNLHAFLPESRLPRWLNLAVGYGAEGMLTATEFPGDGRYRQVYFAPDVDLMRLPVRKAWLRTVLFVLNSIKIPAPALEWNERDGLRGHWLHF
jgi:hypothetical protein